MADFETLLGSIKQGSRLISLSGLTSTSAKAFTLARLQAETGRLFAIVTATNAELDAWNCDIEFFAPERSVISVPSFETDPYADVSPHAETLERRALALWKIAKGEGDIVVASARSLVQRTVSRNEIIGLGAQLKREEDASLEALVDKLITGGYVREEPIAGPGQFSLRGGILDVWSPDSETPAYRVFWR